MSVVEAELHHRLATYDRARSLESWPLLTPNEVRELGIYGGASGVWVDKRRTGSIAAEGVAVGLLHTGRHYDDDVNETGVLYHYPTTQRPESRDNNEIQAIKNSKLLKLPVFVIRNVGSRRTVDLAWLNDFDDELRICVLTFHGADSDDNRYLVTAESPDPPLIGQRRTQKVEVLRAERDPIFKFNILKRFGGVCITTGIDVTEMLDAAHIIPVASGGTESRQNGLLLSASVHRAFDAGLWAINPNSLQIETRQGGPSAQRMKLTRTDLSGHRSLLNLEALEYRYEKLFLKGVTR